jgi:hypothetical protein
MSYNLKKKINSKTNNIFFLNKLKKFCKINFETQGLYIDIRLIKFKKKKKILEQKPKPIQYLKTPRYIIPLPSGEEKKKKKLKKLIIFGGKYHELYDYYENIFSDKFELLFAPV